MSPNTTIMLHGKDINKIAELKNGFTPRWLGPDFILSSLKCFAFSALCKCLNPLKQRGYSFESIFSCLICLPFLGIRTVHSFAGNVMAKHIEARKDVFYRLKNNPGICWRAISQGVKVDYVLMDSWFTCEAFVKAVRKVKKQTVHRIGMYKTPKTKFNYLEQRLTHSQLPNKLGKVQLS